MSRLTDAMVQSQQISAAAKEEASRWDHPRIDVEHLLLALTVLSGAAGTLLRSSGVTVETARSAVETVHARRVASLGVAAPEIAAGPVRSAAVGVTDWSARAEAVMRAVTEHEDDLGYLRALLDEPSGTVVAVLDGLDVRVDGLRSEIERARAVPPRRPAVPSGRPGWDTVSHTGFAPAAPGEVWALVHDPVRRPEWDDLVERVTPDGPAAWTVHAARRAADGTPRPPRPGWESHRLELVDQRAGTAVTWLATYPGRARGSQRELGVRLAPTPGGTEVRMTACWRRPTGWRAPIGWVLRPLRRFVMRQLLVAHVGGVSRAMR